MSTLYSVHLNMATKASNLPRMSNTLFLQIVLATKVYALGSSDEWEDFSNNFATDLAPLLVLFGEQVTKQFLSESTGILDNIIFGAAPLGLLTAVVSVIRVSGSASLKAFIGRGQEAHGVAEAELCSSTSDDVCELWSNGGICRVFGRPWILEFFYLKKDEAGKELDSFYSSYDDKRFLGRPAPCGIFRSREALPAGPHSSPSALGSGWVEIPPHRWSKGRQWKDETSGSEKSPAVHGVKNPHGKAEDGHFNRFAPYPNLSLNFGIRPVTPFWHWAAVVAGVMFQSSFFGYATWATFYQPSLYEKDKRPQLWSFCVGMSGTAFVWAGMTLSARLIEQRSEERTFQDQVCFWFLEVSPPLTKFFIQKKSTTVFWLQPGGQRIGDQLFKSFSYFEKSNFYMTSWKKPPREEEKKSNRLSLVTSSDALFWVALFLSICGFICQFVGFRGLHASIPLYQLAITLIMAIIRAFLRTKRLARKDNSLEELEKLVEGHELDWQALNLETFLRLSESRGGAARATGKKKYWFIADTLIPLRRPPKRDGSTSEKHAEMEVPERQIALISSDDVLSTDSFLPLNVQCANIATHWVKCNEELDGQPNEAARLLHYRTRLAYLTDDVPEMEEKWNTDVREMAGKLRDAIQETADYVLSSMKLTESINDPQALLWSTSCRVQNLPLSDSAKSPYPIHFTLFRRDSRWIGNKNQFEAAIGLWAWSLKEFNRGRTTKPVFESGQKAFLLSTKLQRNEINSILHLWITQAPTEPHEVDVPPSTYQGLRPPETDNQSGSRRTDSSDRGKVNQSLHLTTASASLEQMTWAKLDDSEQALLWWIPTRSSFMELVAQDIFTIFITRLADILEPLHGVQPRSHWSGPTFGTGDESPLDQPYRGITNPHIKVICDIFTGFGLGTQEDALASIVPPFFQRSKLPQLGEISNSLLAVAKTLKRDERYKQADSLLRSLVQHSLLPQDQRKAMKLLCELYRKAVLSHAPNIQATLDAGNELMKYGRLPTTRQLPDHLVDILKPYQQIWESLKTRRPSSNTYTALTEEGVASILKKPAMPHGLTLVHKLTLEKERTNDALAILQWAIEGECTGLIEDLWGDPRVLVNLSFADGRVPLLIAIDAQVDESVLEALLEWPGGRTNLQDRSGRTPLMAASETGMAVAVKLLLQHGADPNVKDSKGSTALVRAVENRHRDVVESLLTAGAEVNVPSSSYGTVLHAAVEWSTETLRLILNRHAETEHKDSKGRTPLLLAVVLGEEAAVEELLARRASIAVRSYEHRSLLHAAAQSQKPKIGIVRKLLRAGATSHLEIFDDHGRTPLLLAVEQGNVEIVSEFLNMKQDPTSDPKLEAKDLKHRTALLVAVEKVLDNEGVMRQKYMTIVKLLLEANADVNAADSASLTALHRASRCSNVEVVSFLMKHRADASARDKGGRTPLLLLLENANLRDGLTEVLEQLLVATPDIDQMSGEPGAPLAIAAYRGYKKVLQRLLPLIPDINSGGGKFGGVLQAAVAASDSTGTVEFLLESGADLNHMSKPYGSALHVSLHHNHMRVFDLLIEKGTDVELIDPEGRSPLMLAVELGLEKPTTKLLAIGASHVTKYSSGQTLLMMAVGKRHISIARILLDHGISPNAPSAHGQTPLLLAVDNEDLEILNLLIENNADVNYRGGRYGCALNGAMYLDNSEMITVLKAAGAKQFDLALVAR